MQTLLEATRGKVFTPKTFSHLVDCTSLANFKTIEPATTPGEIPDTLEAIEQQLEASEEGINGVDEPQEIDRESSEAGDDEANDD